MVDQSALTPLLETFSHRDLAAAILLVILALLTVARMLRGMLRKLSALLKGICERSTFSIRLGSIVLSSSNPSSTPDLSD